MTPAPDPLAMALSSMLLASAVAVWPASGRGRLPRTGSGPGRGSVHRRPWMTVSWARAVGAVVGLGILVPATAVAGAAGLLASAMLLATLVILGRRMLAERRRAQAMPEILRGLRALNRELRTGADPLAAAEAAAGGGRDAGGRVIGALVLLMRTGEATVTDAAPASAPGAVSPADRVLDSLRSGWLLSRRHGVAFGRVITGIADELADQLSADQARAAQLAGPRMSGYVMAALPLMGVLLGAGMGVNPAQVLLGSPLGNLLLVVGVALMCAGLLWSARIVGR